MIYKKNRQEKSDILSMGNEKYAGWRVASPGMEILSSRLTFIM